MKQLTIRGLPKSIVQKIKKLSKDKGISYNKAVIYLLSGESAAHKQPVYHDLDSFVGKWSADDSHAFDAVLDAQRTIDQDLWNENTP